MSTARARREHDRADQADALSSLHPYNTGAYVLTEEEADELEQACLDAEEDEKAGRLVSHDKAMAALYGD